MEQNRVVMIDEESFKAKAVEVVEDMFAKGGSHLTFVAMIAFIELQHKLFQEVPEKAEQE